MNSGNKAAPFAMIGGMAVALYIAASILMDEGNQLASLFFYFLIASAVLGLVAPRLSFFLFIFECGYLDLLKRLMVFAGNVGFSDLFWVLGIAPVTIVGISGGLIMRILFGQIRADSSDIRRLMIAVSLNVGLALLIFFKGGGLGGTAREVANGSTYALLIFIVPILFRTPEQVAKLTRLILIVFLPVTAYTIYQQIFGFQEFEIEYLKTGLSIEIKQLEANRVRPFGTLNSPTSISVVAASLVAMAYSLWYIGHRDRKLGLGLPLTLIVSLLGVGAWAASTVRVGILLLPMSMIGMFVFTRPNKTRLFYSTLVMAFITLVISSDYIYHNIERWSQRLFEVFSGDGYLADMINMNTYKDRLSGFSNVLMNPSAYTLFGMPHGVEDAGVVVHDPLSNALLSFGIVPLVIILALAIIGMKQLHGLVFGVKDRTLQLLAASFLANAAGNIAVSLINGNLLTSFPVNVFLWVSFGFVLSVRRADAEMTFKSRNAAVDESKEVQSLIRPPQPRFVMRPSQMR